MPLVLVRRPVFFPACAVLRRPVFFRACCMHAVHACTACTASECHREARAPVSRRCLPTQPLPNVYFAKMQAMRAGRPKGPLRCAEREGREQHTSQQDTSQGLGWPHTKAGGEATCERPGVRRLKDGKAVVPAAARAPHVRPSLPPAPRPA